MTEAAMQTFEPGCFQVADVVLTRVKQLEDEVETLGRLLSTVVEQVAHLDDKLAANWIEVTDHGDSIDVLRRLVEGYARRS